MTVRVLLLTTTSVRMTPNIFPLDGPMQKNPLVYAPSTLTQHEARTQEKNRRFLSIMTTYIVQWITTLPPRNALKMEHSTSKKFEVGI